MNSQVIAVLWNDLEAWLDKKGGFTHVVAGLAVTAIGAYAAVPAFHSLVMSLYAILPAWAEQIALALVGLYVWYRNPNQ